PRSAGASAPRSRYRIYEQSCPHFLTCTVVAWLPIFSRRETVQIILDSWRFLQREIRLVLYGYVILENHLHLIAAAENLSKTMKELKSFTALRLLDCLKEHHATMLLQELQFFKARHKIESEHQLWQEGS